MELHLYICSFTKNREKERRGEEGERGEEKKLKGYFCEEDNVFIF